MRFVDRGRTAVLALTLVLCAAPVTPSIAASPGASTTSASPQLVGDVVPDPITFAPGGDMDALMHRPEGLLGFGERSGGDWVPGREAVGAVVPGPVARPAAPVVTADSPALTGSISAPGRATSAGATVAAGGETPNVTPAPIPASHGLPTLVDGAAPDAVDPQIQGTVSAGGGPLAGAAVVVENPVNGKMLYLATAAVDGTYGVAVAAGTYVMRFVDPAETYLGGMWSAAGYTRVFADATQITVDTADVTGIDITLPLYPSIRGTVTTTNGDPAAGVPVAIDGYAAATSTDGDGAYAIKAYPGPNLVHYERTESAAGGWYGGGGLVVDQGAAVAVEVAEATDTTGIDAVVHPWPKLTGRVTDVHGVPLLGVQVSATFGSSSTVTVQTDSEGAYSVTLRGLGSWHLAFNLDDYQVSRPAIDVAWTDITLDQTLSAWPVVQGHITNSSGDPLPGITVTASTTPFSTTTTTNTEGSYRLVLDQTAPDTHSIRDPTYAYIPGELTETGWSTVSQVFTLAMDESLSLDAVMPAYATVSGAVVDLNGAPIVGSMVTAHPVSDAEPPARDGSTGVSSDGTWSMKLAPGEWQFFVWTPTGWADGWYSTEGFAYRSAAAPPYVISEAGTSLHMVIPPAYQITGRVTEAGLPATGIEVDLFLDGTAYAYGHTDDTGAFAIDAAPGAYLVGFYPGGSTYAHGFYSGAGLTANPAAASLVVVAAGDRSGVDVTLPKLKHISGKIVTKSGAPVRSTYVEAWINGTYYGYARSSSKGTYKVGVLAGAVTLWLWNGPGDRAPGWRTATGLTANPASAKPVIVGSGDVKGLRVIEPPAQYITGGTYLASSPGVETPKWNVWVEADAYGAAASYAVSDYSGNTVYFAIPVLKGSYQLWADDSTFSSSSALHLAPGYYSKTAALVADPAAATTVSGGSRVRITLPRASYLNVTTTDTYGNTVGTIDAQVWVNGHFYLDAAAGGGGGVRLQVLPGTYRVGVVDLYGIYEAGWSGDSGLVSDYASAADYSVAGLEPTLVTVPMPIEGPPDPPTGVTATAYHESAQVAWTPPATPATRPIFHATVHASPGERTCTAYGTNACTVTGLTDGTTYSFTVTVSTIVGASAPSVASAQIVPAPVPERPGGVVADPSGTGVAVSWDAPADNGSPITGYTVTPSPAGTPCSPEPATATTCTVGGLAEGQYTFTVTARNTHGPGPGATASAIVDVTPPVVTAPRVVLRSSLTMNESAIPVSVTFTAHDALSGLAETGLALQSGLGPFLALDLEAPTATSYDGTLAAGSNAYSFEASGTDANGNTGSSAGPALHVKLVEENGSRISYSGSWKNQSTASASGGRTRYTRKKGSTVTLTFSGRGVAWVARRSAVGGKAAVYLDGKLVATIKLHTSSTRPRWISFAKTFSSSGKHKLKIVNVSTSGTRNRVDVDAFITLK